MCTDRTLFKATVTNKTRTAGSIFLQLARRFAGPVFYVYVFSLVMQCLTSVANTWENFSASLAQNSAGGKIFGSENFYVFV